MHKLEDVLIEYNNIMQSWRETPFDQFRQNLELLKDIRIIVDALTFYYIDACKQMRCDIERLSKTHKITQAKAKAEYLNPNVHKLKCIIDSGNKTWETLRSQCSALKEEQKRNIITK